MIPVRARRIYGRSRDSLNPSILPLQPRDAYTFFERELRQAASLEQPPILVIAGGGGAGKSVLLGHLFDLIADAAPQDSFASRSVVLVVGGDIYAASSTVGDFDRAFGEAATGDQGRWVSQLLRELRHPAQTPILLVDTLDQLLTDGSAGPIADLLRRLADEGTLIVLSCRRFDFDVHLRNARHTTPVLEGHMSELVLPRLTIDDVERMARAYLTRLPENELPAGTPRQRLEDEFVRGLLRDMDNRDLNEIYTSPLLLGLICKTFAKLGAVPADLTVHGLYEAYWSERVAAVRGRRDRRGEEQEALCLQLAARLFTISLQRHRFRDSVDRMAVSEFDPSGHALSRLLSEGVLVSSESTRQIRFLHQTFAEYAMGLWLSGEQGLDDRNRLFQSLNSGVSSLWPVLRELLLATPDDDPYAFSDVVEGINFDIVDALYSAALAATARREPESLAMIGEEALRRGASHQAILLGALPGSNPSLLTTALRLAERVLRDGSNDLVDEAARTIGQLIIRLPNMRERASALVDALNTVRARRSDLTRPLGSGKRGQRAGERIVGSLLNQLLDASISEPLVLSTLRESYALLGPLGRAATLRMHLLPNVTWEDQAALLDVARRYASPANATDEQAELILKVLDQQEGAASTNWPDWNALLTEQLPRRWDSAQVQAAARLAAGDPEVIEGLADLLLTASGQLLERAIDVAQIVADHKPEALAQALVTRPPPGSRSASAIARVFHVLGPALKGKQRDAARDWLLAASNVAPGPMLPAVIEVDHDNAYALQTVLDLTIRLAIPNSNSVRQRVVARVLQSAPDRIISVLRDQLAGMLDDSAGDQRLLRRLHARLAPYEAVDREATAEVILGVAEKAAAETARDLTTAARQANWWSADYLARLLLTRHEEAARQIAALLLDGYREGRSVGLSVPAAATERLTTTTEQQLVNRLVDLLVAAAATNEFPAENATNAAGLLLDRLCMSHAISRPPAGQSDQEFRRHQALRGSLARDTSRLLRAIAAHRILTQKQVRDLLLRYTTEVDLSDTRNAIKPLADALFSANRVDPSILDEALQTWSTLRFENQMAVAEAVLTTERRQRGGRAEELLRREDTPPRIRAFLLRGLRVEQ